MQRPRPEGLRWDLWILIGWCAAFSIMRAGRIQDTDPYWQVRAGQEWLDGTPLARPDTWSWAPVDGLFYPNSPLWNAALAVTWGAAGSWGMFALTAVTIGAYFALAAHLARRLGASWTATTIAVILTSLAALPMLSPRAGVPAQVLLLAGIAGAYAWGRRAASVTPWLSAAVVGMGGFALSWLGNWIHLSWSTTALGLCVAWAVLWLLTPGLGAIRRAILVIAGTAGLVAGIAAGPYGWSVYDRARAVQAAASGLITEWVGPLHPEAITQWVIPTLISLLVVGVSCVIAVRLWSTSRRTDPRLALWAALLTFAVPASLAGLVAVRFVGVALLTALPLTAALLSAAAGRLHRRALRRRGSRSRAAEYTSLRFWRVILASTLAVVSPFVLLYAAPHAEPVSADLTAYLPANCRLYSPSNESAEILLLRPDVTVWFDGRADYWGRDRILDFYRYLLRQSGETLVPPGTTCVVLPDPEDVAPVAGLVNALDASSDWERAAENGNVILWLPAGP